MIHFFQSDMMLAILFLLSAQVGAFSLTWLKHTTDSLDWYDAEQIVTNSALTIVGTMLSILIAFAIVVVWGNFNNTNKVIAEEINALSDIDRASEAFSFNISRDIHRSTQNYVHIVLQDEWSEQGHTRQHSERAHAIFLSLGNIANSISSLEKAKYAQSYQALVSSIYELGNNRRARIMASKTSIPFTMWTLIVTVSVFVVFLVSNSDRRLVNRKAHCILSLMTASSIALSIILIYSLDNPYTGLVSVDRTPFYALIES